MVPNAARFVGRCATHERAHTTSRHRVLAGASIHPSIHPSIPSPIHPSTVHPSTDPFNTHPHKTTSFTGGSLQNISSARFPVPRSVFTDTNETHPRARKVRTKSWAAPKSFFHRNTHAYNMIHQHPTYMYVPGTLTQFCLHVCLPNLNCSADSPAIEVLVSDVNWQHCGRVQAGRCGLQA